VMQSLQSGMGMVGLDAPLQNIVVGAVLVNAVLIDLTTREPARWPMTIAIVLAQVAIVLFFTAPWWVTLAVLALTVLSGWRAMRRKGA
jgi:D-xylose transport system permease protein